MPIDSSSLNTNVFPGYGNNNSCNNEQDGSEFWGKHHLLYQNLVELLNNTNKLLANPKIPEGMVTREELKVEISKILPGVSPDELDKILRNYVTRNKLDVIISNYISKSEFETRATAFMLKSDANQFITKEILLSYPTRTDMATSLSNFYEKNVIDVMLRNLASKDELDSKLNSYLKKVDYIPFNGYTKQEIDLILTNFINKVDLESSLSTYVSVKALDSTLENYYRKDSLRAKYLSRREAFETFAKKSDLDNICSSNNNNSSANIDLSAYATKEEVNILNNNTLTQANAYTNQKIAEVIANQQPTTPPVTDGSNTDNNDIDLSDYLTISNAEEIYAKKSDLPNLDEFITIEDIEHLSTIESVDEKVNTAVATSKNYTDRKVLEIVAGEGVSLDSYLSKEEAEETYETKETIETLKAEINELKTEIANIKAILGNVKKLEIVPISEKDQITPQEGYLYFFSEESSN